MKLPDLNLFIYAVDATSPRHRQAQAWLEGALSGSETIALAWSVLVGFVRLSTQSALFERPLELNQAIELTQSWLEQPCAKIVEPTERHLTILGEMLAPLGSAGNLTSDAHLAALAIEHGATLCSCDSDFGRFDGLKWIDPLQAAT